MFEYLINPTPTELVLTVARDGVRNVTVFQSDLTRHDKIGSSLTALQASLASTAERLAKRSGDLSPSGLTKEANDQIDRSIKPAYGKAVSAVREARDATKAAWKAFTVPSFGPDHPPAVRSEMRAWAAAQKMPVLVEAALADPALAGALVEAGLVRSGLSADLFGRIATESAVARLAESFRTQPAFQTDPAPDAPLGGEFDAASARSAAERQFNKIKDERALIARVPALLTSALDAIAVMAADNRAGAFARVAA